MDEQPINTRQYRFPQIHKEEINRQIELLEGSIIKPSQSPIWIVPKKEDSKGNKRKMVLQRRMVLDFRILNDKTIGDLLPNSVDILDQLGGAQYFSVCDLIFGFK